MLQIVDADADVDFERVRGMLNDQDAPVLLDLTGNRADVVTLGVEPDRSMVWIHGNYWYQGEYVFAPGDVGGTRVTYRIRNISSTPNAVIRLWQRRTLREAQRKLDRLAAALPERVR